MNEQEDIINAIKELGGKEWQNEDFHRFYFNNIAELYGLKLEFYKTGNICYAELHGDEISNYKAREILCCLPSKVWYDVEKSCFNFKADRKEQEYASEIVKKLEKNLLDKLKTKS